MILSNFVSDSFLSGHGVCGFFGNSKYYCCQFSFTYFGLVIVFSASKLNINVVKLTFDTFIQNRIDRVPKTIQLKVEKLKEKVTQILLSQTR